MATKTLERDEAQAPDLSKYRGQWIAIKGRDVVASGDTPRQVLTQVEKQGLTGWALDRVPENPDSIFVL